MKAYFKPVDGGEWQELGKVTENSLAIENPTAHYESKKPERKSINIRFEISNKHLSRKARRLLFLRYPRLPRKFKKEVKSFRKLLGMHYKKCSKLELLRTALLIWYCCPGHDGINPAWLTRSGWAIRHGTDEVPDEHPDVIRFLPSNNEKKITMKVDYTKEVKHESLDCKRR